MEDSCPSWTKKPQSKEEFGVERAKQVAHLVFGRKVNMYEVHRDYCGIGIAREDNLVSINVIYDGFPVPPPLMSWNLSQKEEFTNWLSSQSDFTLSGHDESAGVFYESEQFNRGNQRITRQLLDRCICLHGPVEGI